MISPPRQTSEDLESLHVLGGLSTHFLQQFRVDNLSGKTLSAISHFYDLAYIGLFHRNGLENVIENV
jgi:hypothetical protein